MRGTFLVNWRKVLKYTGIAAGIVILSFALVSWLLFRQRNALVLDQLQSFLNQSQSGQLTIQSVDLRLFRNFPDISIELDTVMYFERQDSLRMEEEPPIFRADRVFIALGVWPLLNGRAEISAINVTTAEINLVEYEHGVFNIQRAFAKPHKQGPKQMAPAPRQPSQTTIPSAPKKRPPAKPKASPEVKPLAIELENLTFQDVRFTWIMASEEGRNSLLIKELEAELSASGGPAEFSIRSKYHIDTVRTGTFTWPEGDIALDVAGQFDPAKERLDIAEVTLSLDVFSLTASGTYEHQEQGKLNLQVKASSDDLPLLEKMLRQEILQENRDLLRSGDLFINGRIYGELKRELPRFDIAFGARNLAFRLPGKSGSFKNLGFEGSLFSGSSPDYSAGVLQLRQLKGDVPGGFVKGDIQISNLAHPWLRCDVESQFTLDGFDKVFRITSIQDLEGAVSARVRFDGPLRLPWPGAKGPKAKFDASFSLSGLSFLVTGTPHHFRDIVFRGDFTSGDNPDQSEAVLAISELKALLPGGELHGNLRMTNLVEPVLHYNLAASAKLDGYDEVLQLKQISHLRGRVSADLRFDGPVRLIGTHAMDSSRSSELRLDSVSFQWNHNRKWMRHLRASVVNQNNLAEVNLAFRWGDSDMQVKAAIENLMHRIFRNERIVLASGRLTSGRLETRDIIFDSLRTPIVDERISNLAMDFQFMNDLDREDSLLDRQEIQFSLKNLSAKMAKLPDIRNLSARGILYRKAGHFSMDLKQFDLVLPQGSVAIAGDMNIPARRQLEAHAKLRLVNFPWAYAGDLIAEIRDGAEPANKNLSADEMDKITADLDVEASMRTYPFDFQKLKVNNSRLKFAQANKRVYSVDQVEADLLPFMFVHPPNSGAITGIRKIKGVFGIRGLRIPGLIDLNAAFSVDGNDDTLRADFIGASRKAKKEEGFISLDLSAPLPRLRFRYKVDSTPADAIVDRFSKKKFLTGNLRYRLDLQTRGKNWSDAKKNLWGTLAIRSDSLNLFGMDIDDALTKFEKSQKFNLTDLGAVVLVGPVGIVATKGSDFVALATIDVNNRQQTRIRQLLASWKLQDQVLETTDVAFATAKNRIAFKGAIDFGRDSIPGVQVAVIDKNGCSLMDQKLYGKFSAIKTGKLNIAKTLLGSVTNFVDALVGKDCVPVYSGEVKDPNQKK